MVPVRLNRPISPISVQVAPYIPPTLLNILMALAAVHRAHRSALRGSMGMIEMSRFAFQVKGTALKRLNDDLADPDRQLTDTTFGCVLLLLAVDVGALCFGRCQTANSQDFRERLNILAISLERLPSNCSSPGRHGRSSQTIALCGITNVPFCPSRNTFCGLLMRLYS